MKIKKWGRLALIPLVIVAVGATVAGCSSKSNTTTTTQVNYTVQKGTVAQSITAVGTVNYSQEDQLSFDTGGTLSEVDVKVGDSVKKDQVLAKLDMTEYQQSITSLQEQLAQKNVSLASTQQQETQAEQAITTAQQNVTTAQNNLAADQFSLAQDQTSLQNYQAQSQLELASDELAVKQAQYAFDTNTGGTWGSANLALKKQQLTIDQASIQATLNADNNKIVVDNNKIEADQAALQTAQNNVANTQAALSIAKMNLTNAQQAVTDAQTALDQANATSPEITAPYDGLVIAVNTTAGQTIYKGQTIVTIVDPTKFEADISIGETDVPNIKLDGNAVIQFDALPDVALPGKIASIAPTATTSQGVVSYAVTVDVESLQNMATGFSRGTGGQGTTTGSQSGQRQFTPGQNSSGTTGSQRPGGNAASSSGTPATTTTTTASEAVQLRQGMTATVDIVYQMVNNVLVVPNQAITLSGNTATVDVLKNGTVTKETIQTGLSNSTLTEVTSGLNEGDTVVYSRTTSSSSASSSSSARPGGFPGGGGGGLFIRGG